MHLFRGLLHFQNADNLQCASDSSSQITPARFAVCCCSPVILVAPNPKQKKFRELAQGKFLMKKETSEGFGVFCYSNKQFFGTQTYADW